MTPPVLAVNGVCPNPKEPPEVNDLFDLQGHEYDDSHLSRQERRELAARRKRAAKRRRASLIATLISVLVIGAIVVVGWKAGARFFGDISPFASKSTEAVEDYEGQGTEPVEVEVKPGDSGAAIAQTLYANGVIASVKAYTNAAIANPDSSKIQPGTYALYKELPAAQAISMLLDLNNLSGNRIQVIPGEKNSQTFQKIKKVTGLTDEEINAALEDSQARGLPEVAGGSFEGWLADGDYRFGKDVTAEEIISEMVSRSVTRLNKLEIPEDKWEKILNVASIVQREAGRDEDFGKVASVIYNRLNIDMKLQMDSTVHYKFGGSADASTSADQRADDNPWNTYKYVGLPKTPIATPSEQAIRAALNPDKTDYIYFVAVNPETHETKFAATFAEHQKNQDEYKKWLADNADRLNSKSDGEGN